MLDSLFDFALLVLGEAHLEDDVDTRFCFLHYILNLYLLLTKFAIFYFDANGHA